jgi:hypothetical protein
MDEDRSDASAVKSAALLMLWMAGGLSCLAADAKAPPAGKPRDAGGGRYETYTRKVAEGPKMQLAAATYFGSESVEEFIAGGDLPDGGIVAIGNAWGPQFPNLPKPRVLGIGRHTGASPTATEGKHNVLVPNRASDDAAGLIVVYGPNLKDIRSVARFDWGVANVSAGIVTPEGDVLLAGRHGEAFDAVTRMAALAQDETASLPTESAAKTKAAPQGLPVPVYLMKLSPATDRIAWVVRFKGLAKPPKRLWLDRQGNVYFEALGLRRISADGKTHAHVCRGGYGEGTSKIVAVDPSDGSSFFGGDRNTNTGKEPWRQPYLYKQDQTGKTEYRMWEWAPRGLRDGSLKEIQGAVSDTSPRHADIAGDQMVVGLWSDGGNTVCTRQPLDYTKPVPPSKLGISCWGMIGASSITHLVRFDLKTKESSVYLTWMAFYPSNFHKTERRNRPSAMRIEHLRLLPGGGVAVTGGAAVGLIQTPNAFWMDPGDGTWYSGEYVTVFAPDLNNFWFSSYLPGISDPVPIPTKEGVLIVSHSRGSDGRKSEDGKDLSTPSPVKDAVQDPCKGPFDAHLLLLKNPL